MKEDLEDLEELVKACLYLGVESFSIKAIENGYCLMGNSQHPVMTSSSLKEIEEYRDSLQEALDIVTRVRAMSTRLRTQDNRGTRDPVFLVQVCERVGPILEGYSDSIMYYDSETCEVYYADGPDKGTWNDLQRAYKNENLKPTIIRSGYKEVWETKAVCFTEAGAEEHLELNGHNYRHYHGTRIYAECLYRNPEMQHLRKFIMNSMFDRLKL